MPYFNSYAQIIHRNCSIVALNLHKVCFIISKVSHHNYDFPRLPSPGILLVPMMAPRSARVFSTLTGSSALFNLLAFSSPFGRRVLLLFFGTSTTEPLDVVVEEGTWKKYSIKPDASKRFSNKMVAMIK